MKVMTYEQAVNAVISVKNEVLTALANEETPLEIGISALLSVLADSLRFLRDKDMNISLEELMSEIGKQMDEIHPVKKEPTDREVNRAVTDLLRSLGLR